MNKKELIEKKYMFQYALQDGTIYEDTWLITFNEAKELRDKYFLRCKQNLSDWDKPQMCIWKDCKTETDYSTILEEINYYNCEIRWWTIYRVETKLTEISSDLLPEDNEWDVIPIPQIWSDNYEWDVVEIKDYVFKCRKCEHNLFVSIDKLTKLQNIDCPECWEEWEWNWIFLREGNRKKEKKYYKK